MNLRSIFVAAVLSLFIFSSCEKKESPVILPPSNGSQMATVSMGIDYETQIYFDFSTNSVVKTIPYKVWDLAFETDKDGRHVFMNGAKNIFIYNTHETDPSKISDGYQYGIKDTSYSLDAPCGLPDSTGVGEWYDATGTSKNEVYLVNIKSEKTYKKFVLKSVNETGYTLAYGDLADNDLKTITIPKNNDYNYSFFSFGNGGEVVNSEPPKATWDIVFTYYRYIFYDLDMPYLVSGVLLNPYKTSAFLDSTTEYTQLDYSTTTNRVYSNHRDAIGYTWKDVKINTQTNTAEYTTRPDKVYVVKNRNDEYWKLHFIGFYDENHVKGNPSFEFERIQ